MFLSYNFREYPLKINGTNYNFKHNQESCHWRVFEHSQTLTNFSFSNTLTGPDTKLLFILVSLIYQPLTARIP